MSIKVILERGGDGYIVARCIALESGIGLPKSSVRSARVIENEPRNTIQAPSGAACLRIHATPDHIPVFISMPFLRSSAAFNGHAAINS